MYFFFFNLCYATMSNISCTIHMINHVMYQVKVSYYISCIMCHVLCGSCRYWVSNINMVFVSVVLIIKFSYCSIFFNVLVHLLSIHKLDMDERRIKKSIITYQVPLKIIKIIYKLDMMKELVEYLWYIFSNI